MHKAPQPFVQHIAQKIVPPALLGWQYILLAFFCGLGAGRYFIVFFIPLLFLLFITIRSHRHRIIRCSALVLFFALGLLWMFINTPTPPPMPDWLQAHFAESSRTPSRSPGIFATGTVVDVTPRPNNRMNIVLEHVTPTEIPHATAYSGYVLWSGEQPEVYPTKGQRLHGFLILSPEHGFANKHTWNMEQSRNDQGIWLRARTKANHDTTFFEQGSFLSKIRTNLYFSFLRALPQESLTSTNGKVADNQTMQKTAQGKTPSFHAQPAFALTPGATLLPALIFGDRSFIDPVVTERINKSTLAHSLSLSGLHLGYALMVAFAGTYVLTWLFPALMLHLPRPYLTLLLGLPCTLIYMWLGAAPLSLQRAFFMYFCAGALFCLRKPAILLDGLLLALLIIFIVHPLYLFDISLQLSALSIAAMAWFLPLGYTVVQTLFASKAQTFHGQNHPVTFAKRGEFIAQKLAKGIAYMFFTSCCIQLALIPLLLQTFGTAGLWLPLNILWLPVLGLIVMPFAFMGLLFTSLSLPLFAKACLYLASLPCHWLLWLLEYMDAKYILIAPLMPRPHWLFIIGFWLICLALPFLIQKIWLTTAHFFTPKNTFSKKVNHCVKSVKKYFMHPQWYKSSIKVCSSTPCLALTTGFLLCLLGMYIPAWQQPKGVTLDVFDVGAAQAIVVSWNTPQGKGRTLIDGGNLYEGGFDTGKYIITPALTYATRPKLYSVINSHADSDHLGGLVYIVNNFAVKHIVKSNDTANPWLQKQWESALEKTRKTAEITHAGQTIYLTEDLYFEVLWPKESEMSQDFLNYATRNLDGAISQKGQAFLTPTSTLRNSQSLILRLMWQGKPLALLCGDLGAKDLTVLSKMPVLLHAPVLVLPHHGSLSSYSSSFYHKVQPLFAIASCPFTANRKPLHEKIIQSLELLQVQLFTTAIHGQTTFTFTHPEELPIITTVR